MPGGGDAGPPDPPAESVLRRGGWRGFTILELLVAITVLALVLVLAFQIVGMIGQTWIGGRGLAETQTQSRVFFDLIARDLRGAVLDGSLPAFQSNRFAFYTLRPASSGGSSTNRVFCLVEYAADTNAGGIFRREADLSSWAADPTNAPLQGTNLPAVDAQSGMQIADAVPIFDWFFIHKDGTASKAFTDDVAVLRVSAVIMDRTAFANLPPDVLSGFRAALADPSPEGVTGAWRARLDTNGWKVGGILLPDRVRRGTKFYERTYPLPTL
jgi:prepilin-type N-terminal cleavage/methylation domain-containing protein